jgi:hypothetical protein
MNSSNDAFVLAVVEALLESPIRPIQHENGLSVCLVVADLVFGGNAKVQRWLNGYLVNMQQHCLKVLVKVLHGIVNTGKVYNSVLDEEWGIIIVNEVMWFIGEYMGIPGVNYTWFEQISMPDEVRYSMLAAVSPRLANFMNGITY